VLFADTESRGAVGAPCVLVIQYVMRRVIVGRVPEDNKMWTNKG
jgi:hypothetical protein